MDNLCAGEPLWDSNITWNTATPDFTPCFQKTLLQWIPCAYIFLFSPLRMYFLTRTNTKMELKNSGLFVFKTILCRFIGLISCVEIMKTVLDLSLYDAIGRAEFITPLITFIAMVVATHMTEFERQHHVMSSGFLLSFWFLFSLSSGLEFQSKVRNIFVESEAVDMFRFTSLFLQMILAVFQLIIVAIFLEKGSGHETKNGCVGENATFLSKLFFVWYTRLVREGFSRSLKTDDMLEVPKDVKAKAAVSHFQEIWTLEADKMKRNCGNKQKNLKSDVNRNVGKKEVSLIKVLLKANMSGVFLNAFNRWIRHVMEFLAPVLLKWMIDFANNKENYLWHGIFYAGLCLLNAITQSLMIQYDDQYCDLIGFRMRTSIMGAVYRKMMKLSNEARKSRTVGEMVNLMSVDAVKLTNVLYEIHYLWIGPVQTITAVYFLNQEVGVSAFAGFSLLLIFVPLNVYVARKIKELATYSQIPPDRKGDEDYIKRLLDTFARRPTWIFHSLLDAWLILYPRVLLTVALPHKNARDLQDERMKVMNEVFNGVKVLKFYAWEPSFRAKILEIRKRERNGRRKRHLFAALSTLSWETSQFFIMFVIFAVYLLFDDSHTMAARTVFVTISLFNILRVPVLRLPLVITNLGEVLESLKRLQNFLNSEEIDPNAIKHNDHSDHAIKLQRANFAWNRHKKAILKKLSLNIEEGELVAIVGPVGAGKSSLLSAIIGEMVKEYGDVFVKGSVAYVTQQAWIQNLTLKDNILFGKEMDQNLYDHALDACALKYDLRILPEGDHTEIGEKGINLSAGQKQRVSLARAVYQDTDIYLFDDPLSAVDAHVGKHIFDNVIGGNGLLKNKTRVLVTHALSFLPKVDRIVTLFDGEISEIGTYSELMDHAGAFSELVRNHILDDAEQEMTDDSDEFTDVNDNEVEGLNKLKRQNSVYREKEVEKENVKEQKISSKLIKDEKIGKGQVQWSVYVNYMRAAGPFLIAVCITCFLANVTEYSLMFWLSDWSNDYSRNQEGNITSTTDGGSRNYRLGVYGFGGLFKALLSVFGEFALLFCALRASRKIHDTALEHILKAPLSFFDTTPIGRMITRFSKDIEIIDRSLPWIIKSFLSVLPDLILTIICITFVTPQFVWGVVPMCIMFTIIQIMQKTRSAPGHLISPPLKWLIFPFTNCTLLCVANLTRFRGWKFYSATAIQLRRICSAARAPLYSHFSESITGATTIRAFNKNDIFIKESDRRINQLSNADITTALCYRWNYIRLQSLSHFIVFLSTVLAVVNRDTLNSGLFALVINYAHNVTRLLRMTVHLFTNMDTNIVSVERLQEYINIKQEAKWEIQGTNPTVWPQRGYIKLCNFGLRYREDLDMVLKGISCRISAGEKIGIVGRTGAGKSSLTLGLFRIIEKAQGSIHIDGIDIATVGLHDLRSKLTIIPQDPVIFSGTIRMNLDPFQSYTDDQIWRALQHAHLKTFVESLENGLSHECTEGGENLSVGQRQLLCLARALLRKTRILVLDEATAAVDLEMDDLIQRTIRVEFADCTILTIAHRLNTIMDYSRIMVLKDGQIAEFDSPGNLLRNQDSIFYGMAKDANLV